MPIYVDQARNPFRGMLMCHMVADTLDELHAMAAAIGMPRRAYQPRSFPHYDVPLDRRARALALGAIEVDRRGIVAVMRRLRADPAFMTAARAAEADHRDKFAPPVI
jgi:hypothetical protein